MKETKKKNLKISKHKIRNLKKIKNLKNTKTPPKYPKPKILDTLFEKKILLKFFKQMKLAEI